ncbi:MAG: PEP-CTERM sorting domain-containing protein [Phycisphaerae bacterium]|nr:PEP-CTERM sorting domain-containing protein [Phycisphaerae bacterium]NUQ48166.1 PEP-CTERM sorting domain-containing protein [Phycisphaerae bacterium]
MDCLRIKGRILASIIALSAFSLTTKSVVASPCDGEPDDVVATLWAGNGGGSGQFDVLRGFGTCTDDVWRWVSDGPITIMDDAGNIVGQYQSSSITLVADPIVSVVYGVQAGAVDTSFSIFSTLTFPTMTNPLGIASASNTLTDTNGNGGTLTGGFGGGTKSFRASYNFGTTFVTSEENLSVGAFGSTTSTEADFSGIITGSVSEARAHFSFVLSRLDISGGTGVFNVVPEPGTLALLSLGGLSLLRRRR